jgi:predicted amidohydrolase
MPHFQQRCKSVKILPMTKTLTIAAAQYPLDDLPNSAAYRAKITQWVETAVKDAAELLVFPEYASMELASFGCRGRDVQDSLKVVSDLHHEITDVHAALARQHGVIIVAGSAPHVVSGCRSNVAQIFGPHGAKHSFTKVMPTPWERDPWGMTGGRELKVFDIGKTKVGLLICYDIEFPLLSRALAEAGAEIILAPSNTETEHGYWRVRTGAQARALENQVYTVHAPVVGPAPHIAACAENCGMAGIFAPPDKGFPANGVLALGEWNKPLWVTTKLDLDQLAEVRSKGGVRTYAHWPEQMGAGPLPPAHVVDLMRKD